LANTDIRSSYSLVRVFDVRSALERHKGLAGLGYLRRDAVFLVFRRS